MSAFLSTLFSYLLKYIMLICFAVAGIFAGIAFSKRKNAKEVKKAEDER